MSDRASRSSCPWTASPSPHTPSHSLASLPTGISPLQAPTHEPPSAFAAAAAAAAASRPAPAAPLHLQPRPQADRGSRAAAAAAAAADIEGLSVPLQVSLSEPFTQSTSPETSDLMSVSVSGFLPEAHRQVHHSRLARMPHAGGAGAGAAAAPAASSLSGARGGGSAKAAAAPAAAAGAAGTGGAAAGSAAGAAAARPGGSNTAGMGRGAAAAKGVYGAWACGDAAAEAEAAPPALPASLAAAGVSSVAGVGSEAGHAPRSAEDDEGPKLVPLYGGFNLATGSDKAIGRRLLRMVQVESLAPQLPTAAAGRPALAGAGAGEKFSSESNAAGAAAGSAAAAAAAPAGARGGAEPEDSVRGGPAAPLARPGGYAADTGGGGAVARAPYAVGPSPLSGSRQRAARPGSLPQLPFHAPPPPLQARQRAESAQPPARAAPAVAVPRAHDAQEPHHHQQHQHQQRHPLQAPQQAAAAAALGPHHRPHPHGQQQQHHHRQHQHQQQQQHQQPRAPLAGGAAGVVGGGRAGPGEAAQQALAAGRVSRPGATRDASQVTLLQMLHFGCASGHVPLHALASLNLAAMQREIAALHWLGQGGGGAVFQAVWQGATVAVKFMLAASPAHVDATALEAIVSLAVGHPNVVTTYAFDVARVTDTSLLETTAQELYSTALLHPSDDASATALYNALMGSYAAVPEPCGTPGSGAAGTPGSGSAPHQRSRSIAMSHRQQRMQLMQPSTVSGSFTAGCGAAGAGVVGFTAADGSGGSGGGVGGAGPSAAAAAVAAGALRGSSFLRVESLGIRMQRAQAAAAAAAGIYTANADSEGTASGGAGGGGVSPEHHSGGAAAGAGPIQHAVGGSGGASRSGPSLGPVPRQCGLESTFFSEEGFGEPDPARSSRAWSVRQVLTYLKARPGMYLTHIIMEYCDRGSLLSAIKRGIFRMDPAAEGSLGQEQGQGQGSSGAASGSTDGASAATGGGGGSAGGSGGALPVPGARFGRRIVLRAVLRTARDIAQGMCHLHANGIIHGDLKPGNVLLRGCRSDRRGFTALVSDFGLSKVTRGDKPLELNHWSTVTVMAPEVILGRWLKASDVFSFGVLLWQLVAGETMPYGKRTVQQILIGVAQGTLKPEWPPWAHPALVRLGRACLATSPEDRPSFAAIVKVLTKIEQTVRSELKQQRTSDSAASSSGRGEGPRPPQWSPPPPMPVAVAAPGQGQGRGQGRGSAAAAGGGGVASRQ